MKKSRQGIPASYYLLMFLWGTGSSIFLKAWYNYYTSTYGTHTLSLIILFITILLSLSGGSRIIGRISDNRKRTFSSFIILSFIAGIYIAFYPVLNNLVNELRTHINTVYNPGFFFINIIRFIISFLISFLPLAIIAGIPPMLIKYFIKNISKAGLFMSVQITAGFAGALIGLSLSAFYLFRTIGITGIMYVSAAVFILTALLALYFKRKGIVSKTVRADQKMTRRVRKTKMRFSKKKTVLEILPKLNLAILRIYGFQVFTITAFVIISFRLLFESSIISSLYYYSSILIILFLSFITGALIYRIAGEKPANSHLTYANLQLITGLASILTIGSLAVFNNRIIGLASEYDPFSKQLIISSIFYTMLIFIPGLITGISLPLSAKIFVKRLNTAGRDLGYLSSVWFVSVLAGILFTLFIFVPLAGSLNSFFFIAFLCLISGIYVVLRDSRLKRAFRLIYTILILGFFITGIVVFHIKGYHLKIFSPEQEDMIVSEKVEGSAGSLKLLEYDNGTSDVFLNGRFVFGTDDTSRNIQILPVALPLLMKENIRTALVIGFGTGITPNTIKKAGATKIQIVEQYPEIIRLSSNVYTNLNDDILTNSYVDIATEDAVSYLFRANEKYDLITSPANCLFLWPQLYTSEFYSLCYKHLNDEGIFSQVIPLSPLSSTEFRAILQSATCVFPNVNLWYIDNDNILLTASTKEHIPDMCKIFESIDKYPNIKELTVSTTDSPEAFLAHLLAGNEEIRQYVRNAVENSGNKPVVGFIHSDEKDNVLITRWLSQVTIDFNNYSTSNCISDPNNFLIHVQRINNSYRQGLNVSDDDFAEGE